MKTGRKTGKGISWGLAPLLSWVAFCSLAGTDPLTLTLSGSLRSSTVNGVNLGLAPIRPISSQTSRKPSEELSPRAGTPVCRGQRQSGSGLSECSGHGPQYRETSRIYRCSRYRHRSRVPGAVHQLLLSGNMSHPGTYTAADLQNLPSVTQAVNEDTYTGVALWSFLGANTTNEFTQYVLAEGTDGYQVLFSLAELDPSLGAPLDLIPYADTAGQFPANGVARLVIPGDNHAGRYVSNLSLLEVTSTPEPSTIGLLGVGILSGLAWYRSGVRTRSR